MPTCSGISARAVRGHKNAQSVNQAVFWMVGSVRAVGTNSVIVASVISINAKSVLTGTI